MRLDQLTVTSHRALSVKECIADRVKVGGYDVGRWNFCQNPRFFQMPLSQAYFYGTAPPGANGLIINIGFDRSDRNLACVFVSVDGDPLIQQVTSNGNRAQVVVPAPGIVEAGFGLGSSNDSFDTISGVYLTVDVF